MSTSTSPIWLSVEPANIPEELRQGKRFVAWRPEARKGKPKPAKVPYSPDAPKGASSKAPAQWMTFDQAVKYASVTMLAGIMRAFLHEDRMVGIDLDNCLDPAIPTPTVDDLAPWAAEIVKRLDTYTEISPSGTGVKLWAYGSMPPFSHKKGDVEMYGSEAGKTGPCGRFFTMTGHQLPGTPSIVGYRPDAILALHRKVFGDGPDLSAVATEREGDVPALHIGDEDVLRLASESAHNGARFRRLWDGDTSDYARDGNDGASEADAALCEMLAYYGGPDPERIEQLWLRSGLAREKTERADYRERTIALALKDKVRFHGDSLQVAPAAPRTGSDGSSGCSCPSCPAAARATYLESALLDRDDQIESLISANGRLSIQLTQRNAEVERLNRRIYADHQLTRTKNLTSAQKDTIRALARVATSRAEHFNNDAPIITGQTLASEIGKHESTARLAAEAVCSLPGAPIKRVEVPGGKHGRVTAYELAVRDPAEIISQFVVIVENLTEKKSSRPQQARCREHPNAPVLTHSRQVCSRCRKTLASTFPGEDALSAQNARIAGEAHPPVSVLTTGVQNARIGEGAGVEHPADQPPVQVPRIVPSVKIISPERRWMADKPERPDSQPAAPLTVRKQVGVSMTGIVPTQEAERRDISVTDRCPECGVEGILSRCDGVWRCGSCASVVYTEALVQPASEVPAAFR
jgi:putative DNA primase/helicase